MGSHMNSKKNKETESVAMSLFYYCKGALNLFWNIYLCLLLMVMPLYFREGYQGIGTGKFLFFKNLSLKMSVFFVVLLVFYLILWLIVGREQKKKMKLRISVTDLFVGIYAVAVVLSYLCSGYKSVALWGTESWYMGFITQLLLVSLYFGLSRFWIPNKVLLYGGMGVSGICFLLGYLNRFGWYPIPMTKKDPLFISTIGNINWFCVYLVGWLCFVIAIYCTSKVKKDWQQYLLLTYIFVGMLVLLVQGSAGGYMTMAVMTVVFLGILAQKEEALQKGLFLVPVFGIAMMVCAVIRLAFPEKITFQDGIMNLFTTGVLPWIAGPVGVVCVIAIVLLKNTGIRGNKETGNEVPRSSKKVDLNFIAKCFVYLGIALFIGYILLVILATCFPNVFSFLPEELFVFNDDWASKRGATWKIGFACVWEQNLLQKIVGVGPDSMYCFIGADGHEKIGRMVTENFMDLTLTNAHMEGLTILVNLGIIGFVGFYGMMTTAIARFIKGGGIAFACAMGLLAYNINNIFSFQQIMGISLAFVFLGMGEARLRRK